MFSRAKLLSLISGISFIAICLATARSSGAQTPQARAVRLISVVGDLIDITRANDERDNTRANAGTRNYAGSSITLDVGGEQNVIGVIQVHGPWATNYPGSYRVEGQRSEARGQKSEVRSQRSEVRGQRSEARSQEAEVRSY